MTPFDRRLCMCGHPRRAHGLEWGWTNCSRRCDCMTFRWHVLDRYWQWQYRRLHRRHDD